MMDPDPRCGIPYGYTVHVRNRTPKCDACRRAHAARFQSYYRRRYLNRGRPLLVDATGTRRRLQALAVIGWGTGQLAGQAGVTPTAVKQWMHRGQVQPHTAARVADLYDRLWDKPGPSAKARAHAVKSGWAPPLAWDEGSIDDPQARANRGWRAIRDGKRAFDEIAVEEAMRGRRVHLRPVERAEAVRQLTALGLSAAEISRRLGVAARSATRIRTRPGGDGEAA
jgi:hypothetical protein